MIPEIPLLLRAARAMTAQPSDAEDLVQDVLVRAYRACDRFDGAFPRSWLLTIMRNTHITRGRQWRPLLLLDPDGRDEARAGLPGETMSRSPEDIVLAETMDPVIVEALDALPGTFRAVVTLVDLHGLSYAETARLLAIPEGTVMSRLHRARRRIRDRIIAAGSDQRGGVTR